MPTIMDVAAQAGVSMKTVSRVLNGEAHVRAALRERVEVAVEALGYRPNFAARQLAGSRSYLIAYLFINLSASYTMALISSAAAACRKRGYHLVSEGVGLREVPEDLVRRTLQRLRPDGLILGPPLADDPMVLGAISEAGVSLVRIAAGTEGPGANVHIDDEPACREIMAHLVALGHRRIGFVRPRSGHHVAQGRERAYRQALLNAGIPVDETLVTDGDFSFASGVAAGGTLLDHSHRPSAIFAANDAMALGVMSAAGQRGLRIPADIAVAGFDDSPGSRMVWPPLTSVHQPLEEMGARAVALLLDAHDANQNPLTHRLVLRGSTTGSLDVVTGTIDA